jgi:stringent starvation protein B
MTSNRPYLLRALNEWILDNGLTPHLLVDADVAGVQVPEGHVEDGKVVLNISPTAVRNLLMGDELVEFHGRFGGTPYHVLIPVHAVIAIYARENGEGMVLPRAASPGGDDDPDPPSKAQPALRIVK